MSQRFFRIYTPCVLCFVAAGTNTMLSWFSRYNRCRFVCPLLCEYCFVLAQQDISFSISWLLQLQRCPPSRGGLHALPKKCSTYINSLFDMLHSFVRHVSFFRSACLNPTFDLFQMVGHCFREGMKPSPTLADFATFLLKRNSNIDNQAHTRIFR